MLRCVFVFFFILSLFSVDETERSNKNKQTNKQTKTALGIMQAFLFIPNDTILIWLRTSFCVIFSFGLNHGLKET